MDRDYIINVILRGQDLLSGEAKKAATELETAFKRVRTASENAIAGVPERQRNELGQYTKEVQRVGGAWNAVMNKIPSWRAMVKGFTGDLERQRNELGQYTKVVERHGGVLGGVAEGYRRMRIAGDAYAARIPTWTQLVRVFTGTLQRQTDELGRVTKEVQRHGGALGALAGAWRGATREIETRVNQYGDVIDRRMEGSVRSMNRSERAGFALANVFRGMRRSVLDLEHGVRDLTRAERDAIGPGFNMGYNLGRGLDHAFRSMTRFNPAVGFMSMALILIVNIVTDLVGALTALASAAAIAAAGVVGAFSAMAAAAVPIIGVIIVAMTRLNKVFAAVQAQDKQRSQTTRQATDDARRRREALERVADAEYTVAQALKSEQEAQLSLRSAILAVEAARAEAGRRLVDMSLARRAAVLGERDAELALIAARQRLSQLEADRTRDFERRRTLARLRGEADPTQVPAGQDLDIRMARQDILQATLNRRRAEIDLARAIQDSNTAQRLGISGAPEVVAAMEAVDKATEGVANAQHQAVVSSRELRDALEDLNRPTEQAARSATAFEQAMNKLDPAEKRLVGIVERVKKTWRDATKPISDSIITAIGDALLQSERLANDPNLRRAFGGLGRVIADQIREFSKFATGGQQRGFMAFFAESAARNAPAVREITQNLIVLFEKMAKAATPLMTRLIERLNEWTSSKAEGTNVDKLTDFFNSTEKYITGIIELTGAFGRLIGEIIQGAAGPGLDGIKGITDQFNQWADWLDQHPEEVREFFEKAIEDTGKWWELLKNIVMAINELGDSEGFQALIDLLIDVVIPVFTMAAQMMGVFFAGIEALGQLLGILGLGDVARQVLIILGAIILLSKTLPGAGALIRWLGTQIAIHLLPSLKLWAWYLAQIARGWLLALGPAGWIALAVLAIIALITWTGKWDEILKMASDTVKNFFNVFSGVFTLIGDLIHGRWDRLWQDFLGIVRNYIALSIRIFTFLPRTIGQILVGLLEKFDVLDDIQRMFSRFGGWLERMWEKLWKRVGDIPNKALQVALDTMRGIVNGIIDGVNWVLRHIGLSSKQIPEWKESKPKKDAEKSPGMADGGIIRPVPGGVYRVAEAGQPEAVIPLDPNRRPRAMRILHETMNVMGLADGGIAVPAIPGSIFGRNADWLERTIRLGVWLQRQGFSVGEHPMFGGIRGRHAPGGYHYSRQGALDVNRDGPTEMQWLDALHGRLSAVRNRGVGELLWRTTDHYDHLHVALGAIAQKGRDLSQQIGIDQVGRMLAEKVGLPKLGPVLREQMAAIGGYLKDSAIDWVKDIAGGVLGAGAGIVGAPARAGRFVRGLVGQLFRGDNKSAPRGPQGISIAKEAGRQMATRFGWAGSQWDALHELWMGESGWRWWARNPSSGAYGIPQALPATKMASAGPDWLSNPITQILWGLQYIRDRYTNPIGALSAWKSRSPHWYAGGGYVRGSQEGQAVPAVLHVGEVVLNRAQQARLGLGNLARAFGGAIMTNRTGRFMMGGEVGDTGAGGGAIRAIREAVQEGRPIQGVVENVQRAVETVHKAIRDTGKAAANVLEGITNAMAQIGGRFDGLHQFVQEQTAKMALALRKAAVKIIGGKAVRVMSEMEVMNAELDNLHKGYDLLADEFNQLNAQIGNLQAMLAATTDPAARAKIEEMIADLQGKMTEVDEAMQANVEQQLELQERIAEAVKAAFQARIDAVNEIASKAMTINDLRMRIAQIKGDTGAQADLFKERGDILAAQRKGLEELLAQATDPEVIEDLRRQLLENELATLENTKAMEEMTASISPQSFSSRAWRLFRAAIFDGMGGLLPQYQIPAMADGGYITRQGMFWLHAGEKVTPSNMVGEGQNNINVTVNEVKERADPTEIASRISWELRTVGR